MRSKTRWIVAMLGSIGVAGCTGRAQEPAPHPDGEAWLTPAEVESSKLAVQPLAKTEVGATVVTSGRVTFDDLRVSHVVSPVNGRIIKINADLGQKVKKGQPLAIIDSPDMGVASSDVDKAQADLATAEQDLHRQEQLYKVHAATQRDYENAQDTYERARAEFTRAVKKATLLRDNAHRLPDSHAGDNVSQNYVLRSLIDGEVVARYANPGVEIQGQYSGTGSELFTIGNLDQVWVLADIFEADVGRISRGQKVTIRVPAYDQETFDGTVDWVSDVLDPGTRTAKVRCVINNPHHQLKPEMLATVMIASTGQRQLTVPKDSVVRLGEKTVVFVQAGDSQDGHVRFVRRPVILDDAEENGRIPVLHGLQDGESVVVSGADRLASMI